MDSLSWRHVDYALKQWGRWVWLYGTSVGCYPSRSSIANMWEQAIPVNWFRARQLTARGKSQPIYGRDRILIGTTMPHYIRQVSTAVGMLSADQWEAVIVHYATGLDATGKEFSQREKALALEISEDALHERLRRARKKLGRLLERSTVNDVNSGYRVTIIPAS